MHVSAVKIDLIRWHSESVCFCEMGEKNVATDFLELSLIPSSPLLPPLAPSVKPSETKQKNCNVDLTPCKCMGQNHLRCIKVYSGERFDDKSDWPCLWFAGTKNLVSKESVLCVQLTDKLLRPSTSLQSDWKSMWCSNSLGTGVFCKILWGMLWWSLRNLFWQRVVVFLFCFFSICGFMTCQQNN